MPIQRRLDAIDLWTPIAKRIASRFESLICTSAEHPFRRKIIAVSMFYYNNLDFFFKDDRTLQCLVGFGWFIGKLIGGMNRKLSAQLNYRTNHRTGGSGLKDSVGRSQSRACQSHSPPNPAAGTEY